MEDKIKDIALPILFSEGRQLQLIKDGKLIDSYDPVTKLEIKDNILFITGFSDYQHNLDEFDDIVVEEFELDENGDRIFLEPFYKF